MFPTNPVSCKSSWIAAFLLAVSSAGMCGGELRHGQRGKFKVGWYSLTQPLCLVGHRYRRMRFHCSIQTWHY